VKGQELWRAKLLNGDVAPSPVFVNGLVYACNVRSKLGAIKPGGTGDVTKSHILWSTDEGSMPDTVSPLCTGELVLILGENNALACFDALSGKLVWEHEYDFGFAASPTLAGKLIYLLDREGVTHVVEAGRQFKEVATCPLGEPAGASPVILGNRLYLRGKQHLFCIGSKE
jgi:outer membrane protein assembly factor BamB